MARRPRDDAFLVTPSNARAAQTLEHWATWPVMAAVLTGPRKSGRSLLAQIFAAKSNGTIIDDAENVPEAQIFHAWNQAQAERRPLVIVADALPPLWAVRLPDLRSRLAASPHAAIQPPDDELIAALLDHLFQRRGWMRGPISSPGSARGSSAAISSSSASSMRWIRRCSKAASGCRSRSRGLF